MKKIISLVILAALAATPAQAKPSHVKQALDVIEACDTSLFVAADNLTYRPLVDALIVKSKTQDVHVILGRKIDHVDRTKEKEEVYKSLPKEEADALWAVLSKNTPSAYNFLKENKIHPQVAKVEGDFALCGSFVAEGSFAQEDVTDDSKFFAGKSLARAVILRGKWRLLTMGAKE